MVTKSFSYIGRAIAPMAVVLAIGFAAPAQAAPMAVLGQLPATVNAQTDVTEVAWRGHRRNGYRSYGYRHNRGYRHHRRGYNGLDVFGAIIGGALLADDGYGNRYYDRYEGRRYHYRSHRRWAPEGWPRS